MRSAAKPSTRSLLQDNSFNNYSLNRNFYSFLTVYAGIHKRLKAGFQRKHEDVRKEEERRKSEQRYFTPKRALPAVPSQG